jgi:hypothetical protein
MLGPLGVGPAIELGRGRGGEEAAGQDEEDEEPESRGSRGGLRASADHFFRPELADRFGGVPAFGQHFVGVLALERSGPAHTRAHP